MRKLLILTFILLFTVGAICSCGEATDDTVSNGSQSEVDSVIKDNGTSDGITGNTDTNVEADSNTDIETNNGTDTDIETDTDTETETETDTDTDTDTDTETDDSGDSNEDLWTGNKK